MRAYYGRQPFALNLPFDPVGKPYVAVQSDMDRAFTLDMDATDTKRATTFPSYQDYVERLHQAGYCSKEQWLSKLMA